MSRANKIYVQPLKGDNWKSLQSKVNQCIRNGVRTMVFAKGDYRISQPILAENDGKFFSLNMIGEDAAHFNLETSEPRFIFDGPGIQYQLCRSSLIKGIVIYGQGNGFGVTVDPFDRGTTSGSSALLIRECRLRNFEAGIVISPNKTTLNAENIHVEKCAINDVKIAYATCQRQSKQNTVRDLICWENVETVFDGLTYGQQLGNIPYINGANIAGYTVKRVFNFGPQIFATSAQKIFVETIEQIGVIEQAGCGVVIRDSHFDIKLHHFPDYHFKGHGVRFENCSMRYYDDKNNKRLIIDGVNNTFTGGYADLPFLMETAANEEHGRTNYYFDHPACPESKTRVVGHGECERYQWLDQQEIKAGVVEVKDRDIQRFNNAYLVGKQRFRVFGRVEKIDGNKIFITDQVVPDGKYHMAINGL